MSFCKWLFPDCCLTIHVAYNVALWIEVLNFNIVKFINVWLCGLGFFICYIRNPSHLQNHIIFKTLWSFCFPQLVQLELFLCNIKGSSFILFFSTCITSNLTHIIIFFYRFEEFIWAKVLGPVLKTNFKWLRYCLKE